MFKILRRLFHESPNLTAPPPIPNAEDSALAAKDLGNACLAQSKLAEAEVHFRRALVISPDFADAHNNLGVVLREAGRTEEAIDHFETAARLNSNSPNPYFNLGLTFRRLGRIDSAIAQYRLALTQEPAFAQAHFELGLALMDAGLVLEAADHLSRSAALAPENAAPLTAWGVALRKLGQPQEALDALRRAITLDPDNPATHLNTGLTLLHLGNEKDAQVHFRAALAATPNDRRPQSEFDLAWTLLQHGHYELGWPYFESRWSANKETRPVFSQPLWQGEDIAGKRIFVYFERGFGDTLHFSRYLPLVAERGAKVIFGCQRELVDLLASVNGVHRIERMNSLSEILAFGSSCTDFDYHVPLLSLATIFRTTEATIPRTIPYVSPDPQKVARWQEALSGSRGLRVGIVWQSNLANIGLANRNIPLDALAPLSSVADVQLFSLQKPSPSGVSERGLLDYTSQFRDFSDTAAFCQCLDLIISVDTSVAHLAGAIGKPVWLLNRHESDWRWMLEREDSPWYPTMRVIRQRSPGDWQSVISRVSDELALMAARHAAQGTAPPVSTG